MTLLLPTIHPKLLSTAVLKMLVNENLYAFLCDFVVRSIFQILRPRATSDRFMQDVRSKFMQWYFYVF